MKKARYISLDGKLLPSSNPCLSHDNRGFVYGDCFTIWGRGNSSKMFFFNDIYTYIEKRFAILGLKKTINLKPEILKTDIELLLQKCRIYQGFVINLSFFRRNLSENTASVLIAAEADPNQNYPIDNKAVLVDIYEDFKFPDTFNMFETNVFTPEYVQSLIYKRPKIDNLLLLNYKGIPFKAIDAAIVYIKNESVIFPETNAGGIYEVFKKIIESISVEMGLRIYNKDISVENLVKLDEIFLVNPINGIQVVAGLGEKRYQTKITKRILQELCAKAEQHL